MDFIELNGVTIQKDFERFHTENPHVYSAFKKLALEAINKGKDKISFKLMMNVIRWNNFIQTKGDDKLRPFKINDAYGSRYARLFADEFPEYAGMIEFRRLRSE